MQSLATITGRKAAETKDGIHGLDVTYLPYQAHVEKTNALLAMGESSCGVCHEVMKSSNNYSVTCPNLDCNGIFHMTCLGKEFVRQEGHEDEDICLPTVGKCPTCAESTRWIDVVMVHSVRTKVKANGKTAPVRTKKPAKKTAKDTTSAIVEEVPDSEEADLRVEEDEMEVDEDTTLNEDIDEEDEKAAKDYENWFFRASEEGAEMNMSDSSSAEEDEDSGVIVID